MKGFVVFYCNYYPDLGQDPELHMQIARNQNADLIGSLKEKGYESMFIPCTKESTRVEKIDLDLPYPRYVAPHVDVVENDKIISDIRSRVNEED